MTTMTGGCLCGAVRFTCEEVETDHHACHCGMCRRWSGGTAFLPAATKGTTFADESQLGRYASSSWAERGFCRTCGSTLFYFLRPTQTYMMSVGAFDDQSRFRLVLEIFIDDKPAGHAFAGDHERLTGAEAFARFAPPEPG